ncbi:hypothetical protein ACIBEJ_02580 [Nonomuraea sp. NPDC050790]|uniref:hypothetical protein n=1 Tax=Nonomuraea sp. NPDC050790 TaxID=3364371 RepID=UPI0037ADAE08
MRLVFLMAVAVIVETPAMVASLRWGLPPRPIATGISHHWALGTGHRLAGLPAIADLLGAEVTDVRS